MQQKLNIIIIVSFMILLSACEFVKVTVVDGKGSGNYTPGTIVNIKANLPNPGYEFNRWEGDIQDIDDTQEKETTLLIPEIANDETLEIKINASYEVDPTAQQYQVNVINGIGSGSYLTYSKRYIKANPAPSNYEFDHWEGNIDYLLNQYNPMQQIVVMTEDIIFRAIYRKKPEPKFTLTLQNGTGSGSYYPGEQVRITALQVLNGNDFIKWDGNIQYITNINNYSTILNMPATNITVYPTYSIPNDDNDNDNDNDNLTLTYYDNAEPSILFDQTITDHQWGTIYLKWEVDGSWYSKRIEHLPNASEYNGRKWQLIRGVAYVFESDPGPLPRQGWRIDRCTGGESAGKTFAMPNAGTKVFYAIRGDDGRWTKYAPYTFTHNVIISCH